TKYPNEMRLSQLETTLLNSVDRTPEPVDLDLPAEHPQRNRLSPATIVTSSVFGKNNPAQPKSEEEKPTTAKAEVQQSAPATPKTSKNAFRPGELLKRHIRPISLFLGIILLLAIVAVLGLKPKSQLIGVELVANQPGARFIVNGKS